MRRFLLLLSIPIALAASCTTSEQVAKSPATLTLRNDGGIHLKCEGTVVSSGSEGEGFELQLRPGDERSLEVEGEFLENVQIVVE